MNTDPEHVHVWIPCAWVAGKVVDEFCACGDRRQVS
jgi:hypothetical protein